MQCLREIDKSFLLNEKCAQEILMALENFDRTLLDFDYSCLSTFTVGKDDNYGYSHNLIAAKIDQCPDKYYLELTKKGFGKCKGNEYYMAIMGSEIIIKKTEIIQQNNTQKITLSKNIRYKKNSTGFERCSNTQSTFDTLTDSGELSRTVYLDKETSEYVVNNNRAIEVSRASSQDQLQSSDRKEDVSFGNKTTFVRDNEKIDQITILTNGEKFKVKINSDNIPDYNDLLECLRIKEEQKIKKKNKETS